MTIKGAVVMAALTPADLAEAHSLTHSLGWPHGLQDWQAMLALGRGIAIRDGSGSLIGTAMIWPWGDTAATVGLILVRPDRQGEGIGRILVDELIRMADGRAVRLHATQAGLRLYQRAGFVSAGGVSQMQGVVSRRRSDPRVRAARGNEFERLVMLDAAAFGAARASLIEALLHNGRVLAIDTNGEASAFAASRTFGKGNLIGPVVAESARDAEALMRSAMRDGFNRIDVTETAAGLMPVLHSEGLEVVDVVTVMTLGRWPTPPVPTPHAFALASQAFG